MNYPNYLVIPSPSDFIYGKWVSNKGGEPPPVAIGNIDPYACEVRGCYVGWVAIAMGEESVFGMESRASREFMEESIREAVGRDVWEREVRDRQERGGYGRSGRDLPMGYLIKTLSNLFEYGDSGRFLSLRRKYRTPGRIGMTPEKAHELWCVVAKRLKYDVAHAVDV